MQSGLGPQVAFLKAADPAANRQGVSQSSLGADIETQRWAECNHQPPDGKIDPPRPTEHAVQSGRGLDLARWLSQRRQELTFLPLLSLLTIRYVP